jgi:succinoglycan biosynthesis protein ExoA
VNTDLPFVSIVIPIRNEEAAIRDCLDAVLAQDYPGDRFEVIVVDGESDDGSRQIVEEYAARDGRVRLLPNPLRIVPTAMNIGIRAARGHIVARVDGHTQLARDYLRVGVETLRRTAADNVGGLIRPVGGTLFGDAVATAMCSRFGIGASFHFSAMEMEADTVYMGMWPRRTFVRFGLFDEELVRNQDDELNYRIRKGGGRVWLNPGMRSSYRNRTSPERLARQFFQYGVWKVRVLQKHPRQMSWRHFVPPCFVLAVVLGAPLATFCRPVGVALRAAIGLYAAGVMIVAARQRAARGVATWLATTLAFVIIHVAWGMGFAVGLVRFADRWRRREVPPPRLEAAALQGPNAEEKGGGGCT